MLNGLSQTRRALGLRAVSHAGAVPHEALSNAGACLAGMHEKINRAVSQKQAHRSWLWHSCLCKH